MQAEVRKMLNILEKTPGVTVKKGGGGHYKVRLDGRVVGSVPATPSDWRWEKNSLSEFRRNGLVLPEYERAPKAERKEEQVATRDWHVSEDEQAEAYSISVRICNEIAEANGLVVRSGRTVAHGTLPVLQKVLYQYHEASGEQIPHLNYTRNYDTSDMREMARLAAIAVTGLPSEPDSKVTQATYVKCKYAETAWDWHLGKVALTASGEVLAVEQVTTEVLETTTHEGPEVTTHEVTMEVVANASDNGQPSDDAEFAVYRLIAKLASNGIPEDDAVVFAIEVRDALRGH